MPSAPLVGLPSDRKQIGHHPFQAVGEKYIRAVVDGAGALPVLIPSLAPPLDLAELLARLDGLLLTGAYSNIEPRHYGNESSYPGNLHDPARDGTTLALVPLAVRLGVPVLAVCRGLQEVNVAFGGALHQKVQEVPGLADHREDVEAELEVQYGPAHPVRLASGGLLARLAGVDEAMVNSLHGQGIRTLGAGLRVEAIAPDGLIEAVSLPEADGFLLAVQWHPEWRVRENPFYLATFAAFGEACRRRAAMRAARTEP